MVGAVVLHVAICEVGEMSGQHQRTADAEVQASWVVGIVFADCGYPHICLGAAIIALPGRPAMPTLAAMLRNFDNRVAARGAYRGIAIIRGSW